MPRIKRYVGPINHLQELEAWVENIDNEVEVEAQFLDTWITRSGEPVPPEFRNGDASLQDLPEQPLGLGWHVFPAKDFE